MFCREIESCDREAVAALLTRGFSAWRSRAFWDEALARLARHEQPAGLPRMGYVLEAAGGIVGVILMITHEAPDGARICNLSSWYVDPAFSLYGALLVRRALRHKGVTYVNVTPRPETWGLLAAQGYSRLSTGRSGAFPLLARRGATMSVSRIRDGVEPGPDLSDYERDLLQDHARWGCVSLVCIGPNGREPFIFGLRRRRGLIPFVYLLHCRNLERFTAHARALGLYLLRHGVLIVVADGNARLAGIPGWFDDGLPKFFRGTHTPPAHDLAYTERAIFGI